MYFMTITAMGAGIRNVLLPGMMGFFLHLTS